MGYCWMGGRRAVGMSSCEWGGGWVGGWVGGWEEALTSRAAGEMEEEPSGRSSVPEPTIEEEEEEEEEGRTISDL